MVPVIHVFYANETKSRGFNAIALYPLANGFTDCDQVSHADTINSALRTVTHESRKRGIDGRAPILDHKVSHARVDEIRTRIIG